MIPNVATEPHSAVFCGLQHARGDFVITMDDDLQNPPEELIHLVRKAEEGHDVVFGAFHQKMHGPFRRLGSRVVSWLNVNLFNKPRDLVLTNFRIIPPGSRRRRGFGEDDVPVHTGAGPDVGEDVCQRSSGA